MIRGDAICDDAMVMRYDPWSKRMDKRSHAWPRGKLIFAVYIFIFLYTFCCLPQPTALDLFLVN